MPVSKFSGHPKRNQENLINILFSFGYLHEKSGLVRRGGLTMFNAFKRMFQPGV